MPEAAEKIFGAANLIAVSGWAALAFAPKWRHAVVFAGRFVPALLGVLYGGLIAARFARGEGGFGSLADVAALFGDPWLLLAGWIHYLAFDLVVGAWATTDARTRGVPHAAVLPCLALTFLFGPVGFLLHLGLRRGLARG
ncbi:MAG: ABA4-like family protein [Gemmatimonadales bacterium]